MRIETMTDGPCFESLLNAQIPALQAFLRLRTKRALRDRESHVDLAQSICREALEGKERYEHHDAAGFKNWLFTLARRKLAERDRHWNTDKRDIGREQRAFANDDDESVGLVEQYATFSTPSMHASSREQLAEIERAFDRLSDEQREVISLVRIAGLSHKEAGEILGVSEEGSRQLLRRAIVRLSILLDSKTAPENESKSDDRE